jgi:tetratricopeptide (TPR) repeat protein
MSQPPASILPHEPILVLLRAGKNDEAISKLRAIISAHPGDIAAIRILADAHFQKRDWASALALAQQLTKLRPEVAEYEKLTISTLSNMKRYDEVIAQACSFSTRRGEDVEILNILKVAHFYKGAIDEAIRCGQRVMEMRDAEMCKRAAPVTLRDPSGRSGRDIIAFTIWGTSPIYNYGAMINLLLSKTVYPEWTCRFYFDDSVPLGTIDFLARNGAEMIDAKDFPLVPGYFRRFLPLSDPGVKRFIVRDCDSRVSAAEAKLVADWVTSGYSFHVIRDHILHNDLILAGLWGGRADCDIDVLDLLRRYFRLGPTNKYGHDQRMLATMVWPQIRSHCLVHDKYYRLPGVHTVPLEAGMHIGASWQNLGDVMQEAKRYGLPQVV